MNKRDPATIDPQSPYANINKIGIDGEAACEQARACIKDVYGAALAAYHNPKRITPRAAMVALRDAMTALEQAQSVCAATAHIKHGNEPMPIFDRNPIFWEPTDQPLETCLRLKDQCQNCDQDISKEWLQHRVRANGKEFLLCRACAHTAGMNHKRLEWEMTNNE